MSDTICAISSALGVGAVSIIRVSGKEAIKNVNKIFGGQNLLKAKDHSINYGHIVYNKETIDEVLVMLMKGPKTYTAEDVVEINCHGSIAVAERILEILLKSGCRLAEPGEFTKRAFLNGRIDLVEAEAVQDLLASETENARKLSLNQLEGELSKKITQARAKILKLLASIEVNLDYPEYDDAIDVTKSYLKKELILIKKTLQELLSTTSSGKIIKSGINVALIGRPNVGKSSILNRLLDEEKSIVTEIPGTTRDIVEGSFLLDGIKINLIDTAGIRNTKNKIERIGVLKAEKKLDEVDLIILVLDGATKLSASDKLLIEKTRNKKGLVFINKTDLASKIELENVSLPIIYGNTVTDNGLRELLEKIKELFNLEEITQQNPNYISNVRQKNLVSQALDCINTCLKNIISSYTIDFLASDIKKAWDLLGEIIGETYNDELLDELFSNFCLGK